MNHKLAVIYGISIWAFVFVVAMLAFPLRANERPFFESIMPLALVLAVAFASIKYFQKTEKKTLMVGLCMGLIWLAVNIAIDLLMFSLGPMKMSPVDYLKDIGLTYLIIPIITTSFGCAYKQNRLS